MFHSIYFFVIGGFLGWMLECTFKYLTGNFERTPGILNTPFCILYGLGTMVLSLVITKITSNFFLLFTLSFLTLTAMEYITFILLQKIYNVEFWDYSDMKFNINGKVCLLFSIIWGLLGAGYIKFIYPVLNNIYNIVDTKILTISLILLISIIITDFVYSSYELLKNKKKILYHI